MATKRGFEKLRPMMSANMQRRKEHRQKDNATKGQPSTDTKRGFEKIRPIMGANITETERAQTERQRDRRTARHRHAERV